MNKENNEIFLQHLKEEHVSTITKAFNDIGWLKPKTLFEQYIKESNVGLRKVWVAFIQERFVGYITLNIQSLYNPFKEQKIPEIQDLNVLPDYRRLGIGTSLLKIAEEVAGKLSDYVGIGVGLYAGQDGGYGAAQKLYVKLGYMPDGRGVTYKYVPAIPGEKYSIDDDLVLWFTKRLKVAIL